MTPEQRQRWLDALLSVDDGVTDQSQIEGDPVYCALGLLADYEPYQWTRRQRVQIKVRNAKWWLQRVVRDKGRRTCGYCGYGWTHRAHCPLTGRIAKFTGGWDS